MKARPGPVVGILLIALSLLIGVVGIAVLIGVGEAANNTIAAFAAVSFPFAILAGLFSWITPSARWPVAAAMCAPAAIIAVVGSWSSSYLMPGALWTVAITFVGAYVGGRARMARSSSQEPPPS